MSSDSAGVRYRSPPDRQRYAGIRICGFASVAGGTQSSRVAKCCAITGAYRSCRHPLREPVCGIGAWPRLTMMPVADARSDRYPVAHGRPEFDGLIDQFGGKRLGRDDRAADTVSRVQLRTAMMVVQRGLHHSRFGNIVHVAPCVGFVLAFQRASGSIANKRLTSHPAAIGRWPRRSMTDVPGHSAAGSATLQPWSTATSAADSGINPMSPIACGCGTASTVSTTS